MRGLQAIGTSSGATRRVRGDRFGAARRRRRSPKPRFPREDAVDGQDCKREKNRVVRAAERLTRGNDRVDIVLEAGGSYTINDVEQYL